MFAHLTLLSMIVMVVLSVKQVDFAELRIANLLYCVKSNLKNDVLRLRGG